jgi:hypothetical protein
VKEKVPDPNHVKRALMLVDFKVAGHPIWMGPFVLIECFLDPALGKNSGGNLVERATPALNRWRAHGVYWNQVGNHLLVVIRQRQRSKRGRPIGPDETTEEQAKREFDLRKAGLCYQNIRDTLYPNKSVQVDAIKQRVLRYARRRGLTLRNPSKA